MMGRNKSAILGYLKDRMNERVQGWDKKCLSRGRKELLIKTVAQALPNYTMSMFLLPRQLCTQLERIMNKFWWKNSNNNKGIHWMQWDRMCTKKLRGGLGFRKLKDFNVALLGKQGWRLIVKTGSLVERVFKARYYPEGSFLSAKVGSNLSFIWRSIMEAQVILQQGTVRRVGTDTTISITKDPWLPNDDPYVHTDNEAIRNSNVDALMIPGQCAWDVDVIKDVFLDKDAQLIMSIPLRDADSDR